MFLTVIILNQLNLSKDRGLLRVTCHNTNSHGFQDLLNPVANCGLYIESSLYHLLHYPTYSKEIHTLLRTLKNIDNKLLDLTKQILTKTQLFGSNSFDIDTNTNILNMTVNLVYLLKGLTNHLFNEFTNFQSRN